MPFAVLLPYCDGNAGLQGVYYWPDRPERRTLSGVPVRSKRSSGALLLTDLAFADSKPCCPDLVESEVSSIPARAVIGSHFSVEDTVANQGVTGAGASTTRYYLSLDVSRSDDDVLVIGARQVPPLGVGATSTGTATLTVPINTAAGDYHVVACADDTGNVPEGDEDNNCSPSAQTVRLVQEIRAIAVTPASGSGIAQTFTFEYFDSLGAAADLRSVVVRFASRTAAGSCTVHYSAIAQAIALQMDDGVRRTPDGGGRWASPLPLGSGTLANSLCTLQLAASNAATSGAYLTLTLHVTFSGNFRGTKDIFLMADSVSGFTTGWQLRGTWIVPPERTGTSGARVTGRRAVPRPPSHTSN